MAWGYAIEGFGTGLERGMRLADYFDRKRAARAERERQEAERERTQKFMSEFGAMEPGPERADFALQFGAPSLAENTLKLWEARKEDQQKRLGNAMLNARGLVHPAFSDDPGSDAARADLTRMLLANSQIFGTGPDRPVTGFDWRRDENGIVRMVPIIENQRTGTAGPQTVNASPDANDIVASYDMKRLQSIMAPHYSDEPRITREETTAVHSIIDRELPHPDQLASPAEKEAVSRQRKAVFDLSMSVAEEAQRRGFNYRPVRFVNDAFRLLGQSHPLTTAMVGARNEDGEYVPPTDNAAYIASLRTLTSHLLGDTPAQQPMPQDIGGLAAASPVTRAAPVPQVAPAQGRAQPYPAPVLDGGVAMREISPDPSFAEQFAGSAPPVPRLGLAAASPVTRAAPSPQAAPPQGSAPEQIARRRALAAGGGGPAYNPNAAAELMEKIWSPSPVAPSPVAQPYPAPVLDGGVMMREIPPTQPFAEQFAGSAPQVPRLGLAAVSPVTRAAPSPVAAPAQGRAQPYPAPDPSFAEQFAGSAPQVPRLGLSAASPVTRAVPSPVAAPLQDVGVSGLLYKDPQGIWRRQAAPPQATPPQAVQPPQAAPPQDVGVRGLDRLVSTIKRNESLRLTKYPDGDGFSIGYGHQIKEGENFDEGITEDKAEELFEQDLKTAMIDAKKLAKDGWKDLDRNEKHVLIEASYVLGRTKFRGFDEFWKAFKKKDFRQAAFELIDSKWYHEQAPSRVVKLAIALYPALSWGDITRAARGETRIANSE